MGYAESASVATQDVPRVRDGNHATCICLFAASWFAEKSSFVSYTKWLTVGSIAAGASAYRADVVRVE